LGAEQSVEVTDQVLGDYIGVPEFRYGEDEDEDEDEDQVGVVTGLAWTDVGGELLAIEAAMNARQGQDDDEVQQAIVERHDECSAAVT
jgi:ATP-dependent Lon protease